MADLKVCPFSGNFNEEFSERMENENKENFFHQVDSSLIAVKDFKLSDVEEKFLAITPSKLSLKSAKQPTKTSNRLSSHLEGSILNGAVQNVYHKYYDAKHLCQRLKNKSVQTDFRESESQTVPWEPKYTVPAGQNPEVLTLAYLTWGHGLPAGMHELEVINRRRIRRAWENIMPPMDTPANIKSRKDMITALEKDEWAYRDAEIQFIMNLRMELAEQLMRSKEFERRKRLEERFKKLDEKLDRRKQQEIRSIRRKFSRELRKLALRYRSANAKPRLDKRKCRTKFDRVTTSSEYREPKPCYDCSKLLQSLPEGGQDESKEEIGSWLFGGLKTQLSSNLYRRKSSLPMCPKVLRRNEKRLVALHKTVEQIKADLVSSDGAELMTRKLKLRPMPATPRRTPEDNYQEKAERVAAAGLLARLVEGRAVQCKMMEGRNRYRELIEELQAIRILEMSEKEHQRMNQLQQEQEQNMLQESRINEIIDALEGKTISRMLTYLTDELTRLEAEKKAHAMALLTERECVEKDIARASREQLELNRRRELDEMYRRILKINQESAETYLEDIVKEGVEWASEQEAERYVKDLAEKTDEIAKSMENNAQGINEEGLLADMIYNFVLPEVEKETTRARIRERQRGYLSAAHASIYEEILKMPDELLLDEQTVADLSSVEYPTSRESECGRQNSCDCGRECCECVPDSCERAIQLILDYADVDDENNEDEIRSILKEKLEDAKKKL